MWGFVAIGVLAFLAMSGGGSSTTNGAGKSTPDAPDTLPQAPPKNEPIPSGQAKSIFASAVDLVNAIYTSANGG